MMTLLYVLHFMVCFVLIAVVLLQRGKGSDLGAALGGGGANTVFGSRGAGNFLTKITTTSAIIFMATSLSLAYLGTPAALARALVRNAGDTEATAPASDLAPVEDASAGAPAEAAGDLEEIPADAVGSLEEIGTLEEITPPESGAADEAPQPQ